MAPLISQNCPRLAEKIISKCIEGGSMKLTTLVDYIYTGCAQKKKDNLNIHIKSEGIIIFSQKNC